MSSQQLELFETYISISVQPDGDGYRATLFDGWYVATGRTAQEAADRCAANYEAETEMIR
jgi:hypothetical protein